MTNGFSYKTNTLYLNLKYGIIKKSPVPYLSFVRWIRFERKETDADGSFYIPTKATNCREAMLRGSQIARKVKSIRT